MSFCIKCGWEYDKDLGANFCHRCGFDLRKISPARQSDPATSEYPPPAMAITEPPDGSASDAKAAFPESQGWVTAKATVNAPDGLCARPSATLAKLAASFSSVIYLEHFGEKVSAKSIMGLMMLAAGPGSEVTVYAKGADAEVAVAEIVALFSRDFDILPPLESVRFPRVVILDDEPWYLKMLITTICQAYPQAKIISFDDGDKALNDLTEQDPDLFIFDDDHPGISGCEIAERLAARKVKFPMIFAIEFRSDKEMSKLRLVPLEMFLSWFPASLKLNIKVLQKPFYPEELLKVIRKLGI